MNKEKAFVTKGNLKNVYSKEIKAYENAAN